MYFNRSIGVLVFRTLFFLLPALGTVSAEETYRMLDTPVLFTGPESQRGDAAELKTIRIGLFAPDESRGGAARGLVRGVSVAIEAANAEGGFQGVPFEIVRRWADDPWGAGSKEVLSLAHIDRVWTIIGSVGGEPTHVAEQIATKLWLPLVSPVVSDPSLTHINLPWIFRLPPNDRAQAEVLIGEGVVPQDFKKVGLVTSTDHDGRYAAKELVAVMQARGVAPLFHLQLSPDAESLREVAQRIQSFEPEGIVVRYPAGRMDALLAAFKENRVNLPVFIPWIPGWNAANLPTVYGGRGTVVLPFAEPMRCGVYLKFVRDYIRHFGEKPDACAVYAYDAGRLIVQAVRNAGLQRTKLAEVLTALSGFPGASGTIEWDNGGGNQAKPVLRVYPAQ